MVVIAILAPFGAASTDTLNELLSGAATGPGWVFAKLELAGGALEIESLAAGSRNFHRAEVRIFDESLQNPGYFHHNAWKTRTGARVNTTGEATGAQAASAWAPTGVNPPVAAVVTVHSASGTVYVLVSAAGDPAERSWRIRAGPGSELLALTSGTRSFAWRTDEYPAATTVHAEVVGVGPQFVDGGAARVEIMDSPIGSFAPFDTFRPIVMPAGRSLSIDLPDGASMSCPCSFDDAGEGALGAGRYTFRLDGVGSHAPFFGGHVFLIVHDVRVPA